MKKKLCSAIIIAIAVSLIFPAISFADSPVTSTQFYTAYLDIDLVKKASMMPYIDEEIAMYLSAPENPLDIKAAVINAIGWETKGAESIVQIDYDTGYTYGGKNNARRYSDFVFGKPLDDLDFDTLPAHDLFCIGYLMVMDNYFEPEHAVSVLEKASESFPESFSAAMITAIVKAQAATRNIDEWNNVWTIVDDVIQNKNLEMDMRAEAVDIILDYMISYRDYNSPEVLGQEQQAVSPGFITDKPITLTYFRWIPDKDDENHYTEFYNELEKRTNIRLSFIDVSEDVMLQKLNLMAAAGDTPDLIEFPWQRYTGLLEKMAEMDVIIQMDELITEAAPNLSELFQLVPQVKNMIMSDYDGHIYQIPGINLRGGIVTTGPVIRGDLLKKYGLAVPKTIDEWEKMLTVFRDNGDDIVPLSFDISGFRNSTAFIDSAAFIGAFGIPFGFGVRDGKVFYGPVEESYRDFVTTFNRWYKNELLDPEFLILNNSQLMDRVNSGSVAAFIGDAYNLKESIDALKSVDASFELIPVQNPAMHDFYALNTLPYAPQITESGIAISSRNKYPVESMKWIDYTYSEEGYRLFNFGVEGHDPNNEQAAAGSLRKLPEVPGYKADKSITGYEYEEQKTAVRLWSAVSGENNPSVMPPVSLTQEENDELTAIMENLLVYTKEMFAKFVIIDDTLKNFDEYVEIAKKMGIDRAIKIMQTALDRYNNLLSAELQVNGKAIETDTKPYVFIEGEAMLPIRFVIEGLGGSVAWNEKSKIVTGIWNDTVITLKLNSTDVMVDYEPKTLSSEVIAMNKRTYVPVSFIQEVFGVTVHWNENTRIVNIIGN
jgi:putative aldouronate transport system substrate-binding protein